MKKAHELNETSEIVGRFIDHLSSENELTSILLNGHLLIEEQLERIIATAVRDYSAVEDARLGYRQKARLARAVTGGQPATDPWPAVEALNELRNHLVHDLEAKKLDAKIDHFLRSWSEIEPPIPTYDTPAQRANDLIDQFAFMNGMLEAMRRDMAGQAPPSAEPRRPQRRNS